MQQLVLGTAQWGDSYGITNHQGRLSDHAIKEIAELALNVGISKVDTAAGYGDAEVRLAPWAKSFKVTSKIQGSHPLSVSSQIQQSLTNLEIEALEGALVHDWPSLTNEEAKRAVQGLREAQEEGLVSRIGISAYDEHDLHRAIDFFGIVEAVQLPFNILDRRLLGTEALHELMRQGCDVQVRSVFLQGLLAAESHAPLSDHSDVKKFHETCASKNLDPLSVALAFVQLQPWVGKVVVGVTSANELAHIQAVWNANLANEETMKTMVETLAESQDLSLIDPRNWSRS